MNPEQKDLSLLIRELGMVDYESTWQLMKEYTDRRDANSRDELWLLQHPPVFTQGQAGKAEHLLMPGDIPVVQVDRGGQVTYHGPGQLVAYLLIDIKRRGKGVRDLVTSIEQAIIETLAQWGVESRAKPDAPGVYVGDAKIASLGLRVRRGCSYHGLALNVDMALEPFQRINPCGYAGLAMTQLSELAEHIHIDEVSDRLKQNLTRLLGYNRCEITSDGLQL
ncbi:lipoyl(octanoyl) transferase LipB [Aestuariirhabdus sp. Z084]|uniref:lipoyl(octanoyl) transferase LipB n=1 Tax=Aestuariirhabdus haliotis TaxID=2918751 RepID=UPI00201B37ED|nr:lipoyl(octanoyl) transferase LipB [Aestuariirhabdus haliotis]MCL6416711.1 lipoyl(octanoyl) transferase LipB [Aestuariirhabdus haliotis]MCL6420700.1 lipoyl(octanoyl) transferase LipB [Aestuariirhabdus haliotis]